METWSYPARDSSGYLETLRGGRNVLDDPDLREFYDKIVVITRERIWSAHRLKTIFQINAGKFDHLIEGYLEDIRKHCLAKK